MFNKFKQKFMSRYKRRGQVLVFYALLIPLLILVAGVGLDLGWYYLTVSRMQHAADAAVVAGCETVLEYEGQFSDYRTSWLGDYTPDYVEPSDETRSAPIDSVAKKYVRKNLADDDSSWTANILKVDSFTKNDVTFSSILKERDPEDFNTTYYQIFLEEDVAHLFLGGFAPMHAKVTAIAKITHYGNIDTLYNQTLAIVEKETYRTWLQIKKQKGDDKTKADNRSVLSTGNWYDSNDPNSTYRTEVLRLNGLGGNNTSTYGNPYETKGKKNQLGYDDLFIDWQPEIKKKMTNNWDVSLAQKGIQNVDNQIISDAPTENNFTFAFEGSTVTAEDRKRRIHGNINIE